MKVFGKGNLYQFDLANVSVISSLSNREFTVFQL